MTKKATVTTTETATKPEHTKEEMSAALHKLYDAACRTGLLVTAVRDAQAESKMALDDAVVCEALALSAYRENSKAMDVFEFDIDLSRLPAFKDEEGTEEAEAA